MNRSCFVVLSLVLFFGLAVSSSAQVYVINEGFDSYVPPSWEIPDGWDFDPLDQVDIFTDEGDYGRASPSLRLHDDQAAETTIVDTPSFSGGDKLWFWLKYFSHEAESFDEFVVLENDGSVETELLRLDGSDLLELTGGEILGPYPLSPGTISLSFVYEQLSSISPPVALDDVLVSSDGQALQHWFMPAGGAVANEEIEVETYVLVANPSDTDVDVRVLFVDAGGIVDERFETVGADSRLTVKMDNSEINSYPVSTIVSAIGVPGPAGGPGRAVMSGPPIFCERSTYASFGGEDWAVSHSSMGIPTAATEWYFAEGATHLFEFNIVLLNPDEVDAEVTLTFNNQAGFEWVEEVTVPGFSNYEIGVNQVVGDGEPHICTRVESDLPIVAEREMFWPREEEFAALRGPRDAHASVGIPTLSDRWMFAEGATHLFDYYVLLANFSDQAANAEVIFSGPDGVITVESREILPGHRTTVKANDFVGPRGHVSVTVESDEPIYAERSMYWQPGDLGRWQGGHSSVGMPEMPWWLWLIPEGATHLFDNYILVSNPADEEVEVMMAFLGGEGMLAEPTYTVGPRCRLTVNVADVVGKVGQVSVLVAAPEGGIVVDRAMYHSPEDGRGIWRTGHSSLGFPWFQPAPGLARVQVIHNSPDPLLENVEFHLIGGPIGERAADNDGDPLELGFREATEFMDTPSGEFLIVIIPAGGDEPVFICEVEFAAGETYVVVAAGLLEGENDLGAGKNAFPAFDLFVHEGREAALQEGNTDVLAFHGSPDGGSVDIYLDPEFNGHIPIISGLGFGGFDGYHELETADYELGLAGAGLDGLLALYEAPLETAGWEGQALVIFASGFFEEEEEPEFGLFAALPDGTVVELVYVPPED